MKSRTLWGGVAAATLGAALLGAGPAAAGPATAATERATPGTVRVTLAGADIFGWTMSGCQTIASNGRLSVSCSGKKLYRAYAECGNGRTVTGSWQNRSRWSHARCPGGLRFGTVQHR